MDSIQRGLRSESVICNRMGFTLLELIIVIAILSTVVLFVFPRIPFLDDFALNSEARRTAGLIRYLDESSSAKKICYRVWFHLEQGSLEVESSVDGFKFKEMGETSLKGFTLKQGIVMQDIVLQQHGKINQGDVAVIFNPAAGAEPFNLHLRKNGRILTVIYNPYSGKVKVSDGYI